MNAPTLQTIEINGKEAVVLVPELVNQLAVVDLTVLQRLAALLPSASLRDIRNQLIDNIRANGVDTIEQYVAILKNEVAFHESVNMIRLYNPQPATESEIVRPVSVAREY